MDFNNDSTISKPPVEIVNLIIIEHWYNLRLAFEFYTKHKFKGASIGLDECRSRLLTLFLAVIEVLERKLEKETFTSLFKTCTDLKQSLSYETLLDSYLLINKVLDSSGLIKVDTKPYINRQRIEQANKISGY